MKAGGALAKGAPRDPVWEYMQPADKPKHFQCKLCHKQMYGNPTVMKKHIVSAACKPPADVRSSILSRLSDNPRSRGDDHLGDQLSTVEPAEPPATKKRRTSSVAGSCSGGAVTLSNYVRSLTPKQSREIDVKCARWIYRRAMPLSSTSSPEFLSVSRSLNPAYTPLSRFSLAGTLLDKEVKLQSQMVDAFVSRSVSDGDLVLGGDGWTDRLRNSIYNVVVYTPEPLYMETKVWGESKHSAANTANFFAERIEALGARSVVAFVSDTENKMKAVWDLLEARSPWMLTIPCSGHCFDLLIFDIAKHPDVARALELTNNMTQYFKNHAFPKAILERCQKAEYKGATIQLQRPGDTRWKSQHTAAAVLLSTQNAMEKAVVDASFKRECLLSGIVEQRKAAANASRAVKDDENWARVDMVVKLLEPLAHSLDNGQSDGRGLAMVRSAFFRLRAHFSSFDYPVSTSRSMLKQHVQKSLSERQRYTLRDVHTLAYMLDPRYIDQPDQPEPAEVGKGLAFLQRMAAAHDVKRALDLNQCREASELPADYETKTADSIMGEFTSYKTKSGGCLVLSSVWSKDAVGNPLSWWKLWGAGLPNLQAVAVKVMKMPVGFAAGERSFSNAAAIQTKLRTRLSYEELHKLLYIYYNSRVLPDVARCPAMGFLRAGRPLLHGQWRWKVPTKSQGTRRRWAYQQRLTCMQRR